MSSRVLLYILYSFFFLFIINIWGYYGSTAYREFLATIKYGEKVVITDEIILDTKKAETGATLNGTGNIGNTTSEKILSASGKISEKSITMNAVEERVLASFQSFPLKKLLVHPSLFDLTTEYPDEYFEYYSEDFTLYIFSTKTYTEVSQIFEAMATELPFMLNKTDSFGSQSFFINVKPEFQDEYVRIVFEYKEKAFGLKIQKDIYNRVKDIVKNIK